MTKLKSAKFKKNQQAVSCREFKEKSGNSVDPYEVASYQSTKQTVLQIRRGNRDNRGIIIHISSQKHIL